MGPSLRRVPWTCFRTSLRVDVHACSAVRNSFTAELLNGLLKGWLTEAPRHGTGPPVPCLALWGGL